MFCNNFNYDHLSIFLVYSRGDDWRLLQSQEELDLASLTLGELLRKKAENGVRVLLMIWGETTSIMGTHDTETENFFKGILTFLLTFCLCLSGYVSLESWYLDGNLMTFTLLLVFDAPNVAGRRKVCPSDSLQHV